MSSAGFIFSVLFNLIFNDYICVKWLGTCLAVEHRLMLCAQVMLINYQGICIGVRG